jgi:putative endonuclease
VGQASTSLISGASGALDREERRTRHIAAEESPADDLLEAQPPRRARLQAPRAEASITRDPTLATDLLASESRSAINTTASMADVPDRWFVYLARCADGSLYTGIARDVAARIAAHDAGRGARYTRGRGPLVVCAVRRCMSKSEALRLEFAIKRLPRSQKEVLTVARRLGVFARRCGAPARK